MTEHSTAAAGIDTGKSTLDVALASGLSEVQVDNDAAGHRMLFFHNQMSVRFTHFGQGFTGEIDLGNRSGNAPENQGVHRPPRRYRRRR
jgi:hypothetical protein